MDLILRNASVIDGTGALARRADVLVRDGVIVEVADAGVIDDRPGVETVDLTGLVLAPGFIDVHTHYDAQILWDRDLTPSCWHGVTSVVMGNCGFGIAPTRAAGRDVIVRTLENVEGMSADALRAGVTWSFESFPEYLEALRREPARLNVGALVGHTPLRLFVMGDDATNRQATDAEVAEMRALVVAALEAGAVGFSTSTAPTHVGAAGKPVPSRLAERAELRALAGALGDVGRGVMQVTAGPEFFLEDFSAVSVETGRPVSWTAVLTQGERGRATALLNRSASMPGRVIPQISCRKLVMQFTLADPFPFAPNPAFAAVFAADPADRAAIYADPAWRDEARPHLPRTMGAKFDKTTVAESQIHAVDGRTLVDIAADTGAEPFDVLLDLALAEDLHTRFLVVIANDDDVELADLLLDHRAMLGLSDAGAHAEQLCDANFSTHLLGVWCREKGVLTLEDAVWRLTGQPAEVFGLAERGRIAPGFHADLVAFDPATVGSEPLERVRDLPGGADRLIAHSIGIEHVWVNGTAIRRDGKDIPDARPGQLLTAG